MYKNTNTHKFCPKCEQVLPRSEFYKDSARKEGITAYCKPCKTSVNQNWRDNNPELYKQSQLRQRRKREYKLSDKDMEGMLKYQQYQCGICKTSIGWNCHVDHDHKTNKVRGLLCGTCNIGLGMFKDSSVILNNAIEYLFKYM
jgi:hypothetical protein